MAQKTREQIHNPVYFNPHKNMASQLLQKAGLVGDFSPTTVLTPPPPLIPAVQLVGEKTPTDLSHAFGSGSDKTVPKEGHWRKKPM